MNQATNLALEETEVIELRRILIDDDPEDALAFLKAYLRGRVHELLEGG
jgi:hypothetical protein